MKLRNIKDLASGMIYVRIKWTVFRYSNTRFFVYGFLTGAAFMLFTVVLALNLSDVHGALIDIDTSGRIQHFTSIGAAILGVLAITFSLAVFALQHAAENGSTRILKEFADSARVRREFIFIGSIALLSYIFGLTPQKDSWFTSASLLLSLLLIPVILWRVFVFYRFIVKFIDPIETIKSFSQRVKKGLARARSLLIDTKDIVEVPEPPSTGPLSGIDHDDLLVTANFDHKYIFDPFRDEVIALVDRMKIYTGKGRHEVTRQGYQELINIADLYFQVRKYSPSNASLFTQASRTDQYLILLLEQLNTLFSQTIKLEDQEILQQNFHCYAMLAIKATTYKTLSSDVANPNLDFVVGYFHRNLVESIRKGVDDAVLQGIRFLRATIDYVPSEHYLSVRRLADSFKEEGFASVAEQKCYITQETMNGLVAIVVWSLRSSFASDQLLKPTLLYISEVVQNYVASGMDVGINGGGLAPIALVNENSIPYILNAYFVESYKKDGELDKDVLKGFTNFYESIGKAAVEFESFLLHFVLSALNTHIEQLIQLRWNKNQQHADQFLEGITKLHQVYRRIFASLPNDYEHKRFGYLELEHIKETALWAVKQNDAEIFGIVVKTFESFYRNARIKTSDEFTAMRIYVDMVELGAVASASGMDGIADEIVAMSADVQKEQLEKHVDVGMPEQLIQERNERLSHEIWQLYDDYRQYNPMRHEDIKLEKLISIEILKDYLNRIEKEVYSREITERRTSSFF